MGGGKILAVVSYVVVFMMLFCLPLMGLASPCHTFPWQLVEEDEPSEYFTLGREAMAIGLDGDALRYFRQFMKDNPGDPLAEGVQFAMATLIKTEKDPSKVFVDTIGYLRAVRRRYPESPYAPWALCTIGDLYRQAGWYQEAKGALEQFLTSYPGHDLTPGVLISAGMNFLRHGQHLEGSLVFWRVLDEPTWAAFHLEAGLGVADGAAESEAWTQARYWYQAVDLERPELIRASPMSLYLRGLAAGAEGDETLAMTQFLQAINLHPLREETGRSWTQLADMLFTKDADVPALWFAYQASKQFPGTQSALKGRALLLRWAVKDLGREESVIHESEVRQRLAELGIAIPSSWSQLRGAAGQLALATESDLALEAMVWVAQSYQIEDKPQQAMAAYMQVLTHVERPVWSQIAAVSLTRMLVRFHHHKQWANIALFLDNYLDMIPLFGSDPQFQFVMAEAYGEMQLPAQALGWYQKVLSQTVPPDIHEPALAGQALMAAHVGQRELMKNSGTKYEQTYPDGPSITQIAFHLGNDALRTLAYQDAIQQFAIADMHASSMDEHVKARRQIIWAQRRSGNNAGAIQAIRQLVKEQLADSQDRLILADLLFEEAHYQAAASEYETLVSSMEESDLRLWAEYRLALSFQKLGKIQESEQLLVKLVQTTLATEGLGASVVAVASAMAQVQQTSYATGKK